MEREKYFISQGYNLVTIWECELSKEVKNTKLDSLLVSSLRTNLDLHDAFYGGKTEVFKQLTQGVIK